MQDDDNETFLGRWSRRKREADAGRVLPQKSPSVGGPDAEPDIDLATLPKIEDLTAVSDYSVFLKKGVPELLKRQALQQAWTSDPMIRDFIEVAENQYDFNVPGSIPGFGDLPPGTDIKALLAQALGETPAPDQGDSVSHTAESPPMAPPAAPKDSEPVADASPTLADGDPTLQSHGTSGEPFVAVAPEKGDTAPGPRRRRHGGALPEFDATA